MTITHPPTRPHFSRTPQNSLTVPSHKVPVPDGYYSHVVRTASTIHVCGWQGDSPATGGIVPGGLAAQAEQAMANIKACLEYAGSSLDQIVRRRTYMVNMKDVEEFRVVDEIWKKWVGSERPFPVSTLIGVTSLADPQAVIEIEVEAAVV